MCRPEILIADEPTTALDVTIQAQILQLLKSLRAEYGTSIIFITHDFGVVARTCDTVGVMYAGRIIEYAGVKELFADPRHPYTAGLMRSIPVLGSRRKRLHSMPGRPPDPVDLPVGCAFEPRCEKRLTRCKAEYPPGVYVGANHTVACWLHASSSGAS
jgi:oligopeptide/dipeptide ABC transporter ATP-binding protein